VEVRWRWREGGGGDGGAGRGAEVKGKAAEAQGGAPRSEEKPQRRREEGRPDQNAGGAMDRSPTEQ